MRELYGFWCPFNYNYFQSPVLIHCSSSLRSCGEDEITIKMQLLKTTGNWTHEWLYTQHPKGSQEMKIQKASHRTCHDPFLEAARNCTHNISPKSSGEVALRHANNGCVPSPVSVEARVQRESSSIQRNRAWDKMWNYNMWFKCHLEEMITYKLSTRLKEWVDHIVGIFSITSREGLEPVVYDVLKKFVLDQLRKNVIRESLDTLITKHLHNDASKDRLLKTLLPSLVHGVCCYFCKL